MDSSPAPSSPLLKFDAFLSFRAEDTLFFASHLVSGLLKKQLEIFFDIHNLIEMEEKDDTIAPEGACLAAIDQSLVSIVILSEKYASSTWCLTELSRILESRRNYGQRVIPVFYKVDPSHVRYQIGRFGDAFHKHEDDLMKVLDLKKVKSDLEEISNIIGYDSRFIGSSDSEVVNDVVNYISRWRAEKDVVEIELASVEEKLLAQRRGMKSMIQGMAKLDYGDDQPISALPLHEHQLYLPLLRFGTEGDLLRSRRVRPSFFDSMCALQSLALSGTSIKYLPESVFGLPYLRVFFAEDCQLCELPENPRSPLLEFLFLRRNWALRKIPPSFFDRMQAVKCLDLSMTGIKSLPVSSLSLPTLEWLWLRHCELCKLPENPNWPVLEGLYLDGNHDLRTIPPSFFDCMPSLQLLDLSMTGIKSLLNSPFSLPELRSLFLIDCQLCKLLENLMCPELQNLSLRGNRQLRMIPPSFFTNMPALFNLCLSKTPIKYLPDSFFCLKQLEVLHLRDCDLLMTLSPRIGELKCLKDLDLEGTEIMHLPEEVKELKHLKVLRVSFCELPSYIREKHSEQVIYPGTLSSLSELEVLYIDVSPDDERWNQCVEIIVSELSKLFSLKDLRLYVARTEFLSCFKWEQLEYFDLKVGHHAKRLMPRLPSDAALELQKYGRRLTYVNGEGESKEINLLLELTEALFLDRHGTIDALSQFEGFNSLICCVAGECNKLRVLFHGDEMTLFMLEYLHIYYMKSLKSIWEGVIIPYALSHLKSLTLRTCPELTTVFTPALIAGLESLEELTMVDCPAVTNLVSTNDFKHITFLNEPFIPTLKRISLHDLPELTSIFDLSLSPNLSWISIYHFPNLKSLPIDKVKNVYLKKIEGEMNWWKALEGGKIHQQHPWRDVFKDIVDFPAVTNLVSTNDFKHITFLNDPFISKLKRISLHDLPKLTTLRGRKIHQQHPLTARLERLSLHDLLKLTALEGGEIHQQHPLTALKGGEIHQQHPLTARLKRISLHDLPKLTALEGGEIHQQHPLAALEGGKSINTIHEEATAIDRLKVLEGGKFINSIHEEATTSIERIGKSIRKSIDELIDSEDEEGKIHQQHLLTALEGGKSINNIHEEAKTIDRLKALEGGKSINSIHEEATTSIEWIGKLSNWFLESVLGFFARHAGYVHNLEDNLAHMEIAVGDSMALKERLTRKVHVEELLPQMKRLPEVYLWFQRVNIALAEGHELIKGADQEVQRLCFGGYGSKNCWSSSMFGKKVDECLNGLLALKTTGDQFGVVVEEAPAELVAEQLCNSTVGLETKLAEVWSCLEDKSVGIVGLYGIGGVGKTTLLTQIRNKFVDTCKDYLVIWIVVGKDYSPEKIQADIRKATGQWSTDDIFNKLRTKKFILLLDDIWERFDLTKMGIPSRGNLNGSKIIFTTRSLKVCGEMLAQRKIRVETLEWEPAWELFQMYVGDDTINSDLQILPLAQGVASECGGLPIALITIGRAMSCKTEPEEWRRAVQILKKPALHGDHTEDDVLKHMEVEVFSLLKFSYDNLPNDRVKSCFLYCALYPSDRLMYKDLLIEYWVCEDFVIDGYDVDSFSEGYSVMGTLVRSCLLEDEGQFVKLHDTIRDMALWIEKENVLVMAGMQLTKAPSVERWEGLTRLSLMRNNIKNLTQVPRCSKLKSLFLCENIELYNIHEDFFQSMGALVVLHLCGTGLDKLPRSMENLVSLRFLDISWTRIRRLPAELAKLTGLKHLDLSGLNLKAKRSLISSLSSLVVLEMRNYVYTYLEEEEEQEEKGEEEDDDTLLISKASVDSEILLEELQCLKHLKKLAITLTSVSVLERLSVTDKLLSIIKGLCLKKFNGSKWLNISSLENMKHLVELVIRECELEDILVDFTHNSSAILRDVSFNSLRLVNVFSCHELKDLTWLILVPNLTTLWIEYCDKMEEIIDGVRFGDMTRHQNLKPFSKLSRLLLWDLPQLKSIHPNALPFPFLGEMRVFECPLLKELPLDSNSREGRKIFLKASKEWWEAIEWEDDATKAALSSRFKCDLF